MRLRIAACRPAARRTPAASYITIRLKYRVTPNSGSRGPTMRNVLVESAATAAEWLDGMPPVWIRRTKSGRPVLIQVAKNLKSWTIVAAVKATTKGFNLDRPPCHVPASGDSQALSRFVPPVEPGHAEERGSAQSPEDSSLCFRLEGRGPKAPDSVRE